MIGRFKQLLDRLAVDPVIARRPDEEMRLAAAALLIHAAAVDGDSDPEERDALEETLRTRFDLTEAEVAGLVAEAAEREREAVDLYRFTSVLSRHLDQEGRQKIVAMLWEIALADGRVHEFEANLVWRVAELLGVSTRDRVRLRKEAESALMSR
jgi:uncharacterized tellurite resistance protein B-like protein